MGLLVPLRWRGPAVGLGSQKIAQKPVDAYLADARGRCAIVFAPNVRSADEYAADFCALGVRAKVVRGDMSPDDRADALEPGRAGRTFAIWRAEIQARIEEALNALRTELFQDIPADDVRACLRVFGTLWTRLGKADRGGAASEN